MLEHGPHSDLLFLSPNFIHIFCCVLFHFFFTFFLLGTLSLQERVPTNPFLPGPETYLYQCFKSLATMRNIYISKFVLASKHGCP